jgi:manganese transport protein
MALLLQSLSADLGLLPNVICASLRETYSPFINYIYFLAEIAIAACDLAEVLEWQSVSIYCLIFR